MEAKSPVTCEQCGKLTKPHPQKTKRFCSGRCQKRAWNARNPDFRPNRNVEDRLRRAAKAGKPLGPCLCGCGGLTRSKHGPGGYLKGHRPMVTTTCLYPGCGVTFTFKWRVDRVDTTYCKRHAPFKLHEGKGSLRPRDANGNLIMPICACGCGEPVEHYYARYKPGHHNMIGIAAMKSGSPEWRAKVIPKISAKRQAKLVHGAATKVAKVLKGKGITNDDLMKAFGISRRAAIQIRNPPPGRENMLKENVERYLRFAAGLPYEPSNRQKNQAMRADWAWRRRQMPSRGGTGMPKNTVASSFTKEEREATKHLTKPKEKWFK